jgi:hypothetical protein
MATHRLDDLVQAVRAAATDAQRRLVAEDAARRHRPTRPWQATAEQDPFPEILIPKANTRIGRLRLTIPVSVIEMPDPAHPWRRTLALVANDATPADSLACRLSIDIAGKTLQDGVVTVDDIILNRFEPPLLGDGTHDQA